MPVAGAATTRAWDWLRFRRRHQLHQRELAFLLGVSCSTVVNLERGRKQETKGYVPHRPRPQMLERFMQLQKQWEREHPELPWED